MGPTHGGPPILGIYKHFNNFRDITTLNEMKSIGAREGGKSKDRHFGRERKAFCQALPVQPNDRDGEVLYSCAQILATTKRCHVHYGRRHEFPLRKSELAGFRGV
jgi:hypothetical protein